jgi:N-acetylglucosaminyl-diphospho-decaprenol L-rhamnosyltransferase
MAGPDLSVITVTHNGGEMAVRTLASARAATGALAVEWQVVDSGSQDGTPGRLSRAFADVSVIRRPNLGFAAANNLALERARGRYVLLLNPDVEIAEGTLAELVRAMDERPEVGIAGVIQRDADGRVRPSNWRFPSAVRQLGEALFARRIRLLRQLQEADLDERHSAGEWSPDWITGSFLIVRRAAYATVGPLDPRFFLYSEETDWCRRFRDAGWDVRHLPVVSVVHHHDAGAQPELVAQLSYSKRLYAAKHLGRAHRAAFVAALVLRHLIRVPLFAVIGLARPAARTRLRAEALGLGVALGRATPSLTRQRDAVLAAGGAHPGAG